MVFVLTQKLCIFCLTRSLADGSVGRQIKRHNQMKNKVNISRTTQLLSLVLLVLACHAEFVSADTLEQRIHRIAQRNGAMTAQFSETKVLPRMKKTTTKKGTLYFKTDSESLLMRYSDPVGDYTLIKDGVMYIKKGDKQQKFSGNNQAGKMAVLKSSLLNAFVGDIEAIAKDNKATVKAEESNTRYRFVITRKNEQKQGINQLTLLYDKATGALLMLKIEEANGNYTTYETTDPDVKTILSDDIFEL